MTQIPAPYSGMHHPGGPGIALQHRQASSRYAARAKRPALAWALWILGPFMLHAPIHDFYLGAIGRGLLKLALSTIAWGSFVVAYVIFSLTYAEGRDTAEPGSVGDPAIAGPGPIFWALLILAAVIGLAVVIWWILDGITMSRRLERLDRELREELSREHGIDPWSL